MAPKNTRKLKAGRPRVSKKLLSDNNHSKDVHSQDIDDQSETANDTLSGPLQFTQVAGISGKKKMRLLKDQPMDDMTCGPLASHLLRMPFEILAEILVKTASPKDLLAVARCSKFFCDTLVRNQSSQFIWRRVRAGCKPAPIPDPTPNFTESSYAVFLFDSGNCEICGKFVKKSYASFALRVRLCSKVSCRQALKKHFVEGNVTVSWLPSIESSTCLFPEKPESQWPNTKPYHRLKDWNEAKDYNSGTATDMAYILRKEQKVRRMMPFSKSVYIWYKLYLEHYQKTKKLNGNFAQRMATSEGWDQHDLLMTSAFGQLNHYRTKLLEEVTQLDYDLIRPELDDQILRITERRKRRAAEQILHQRRTEVEEYLHHLKSNGNSGPLPNLATFRQLPIIKLVQNRMSSKKIITELKSRLIAEILRDELDKWRESAKATLATILGYTNWKNPSTKKLHPVDRLTARFKCKKCSMVARKYSEEECLDFAGVCSHECLKSGGKPKAKQEWQADQFIPDPKAISVISKVLELCNVDPSAKESLEAVKNIGARIMCLSCDATIVMGFQSIVGHCQRHEDMKISLRSGPELSILDYPFSYGLFAKLMGRDHSHGAKKLRNLRQYGCRHCYQRKPSTPAPVEGSVSTVAGEQSPQLKPDLYTFDGLRSHCKQKHAIKLPCDEDFFQIPETGADQPVSEDKKEGNESESESSDESIVWELDRLQ